MRLKIFCFIFYFACCAACCLLFYGWRDLFDRGRYLVAGCFDVESLVIGGGRSSLRQAEVVLINSYRSFDLAIFGDSHVDRMPVDLFDGFVGNFGVSGDTTRGLIGRARGVVFANKFNRVLVLVGYNDLKYREPAVAVRNLSNFLDVLKSGGVALDRVYVHELLPVEAGRFFINDRRELFNGMVSELCLVRGCQWVKVDKSFFDEKGWLRSDFSTDGVHLNDVAYHLFGLNFCRRMRDVGVIC